MKKYGRDKPKEFPENFGWDLSQIHNSRLYFVEFQSVLIYYIGMYVNFRNFLLIYDLILHENEVFLLFFLLLLEGAIKEFVSFNETLPRKGNVDLVKIDLLVNLLCSMSKKCC